MDYDVVIGLDVGKGVRHAYGLGPVGLRVRDREVDNTETPLRGVFGQAAGHGRVLVVVSQLQSLGARPVTVAQAMAIDADYLPSLSMPRLADLHPGSTKTNAPDAYVIANQALTVPHPVRRLDIPSDAQADLAMPVDNDDDLAGQVTSAINRLRRLLVQNHPSLEKALGDNVSHEAVLRLLINTSGPDGMRKLGQTRIAKELAKHSPPIHGDPAEQVLQVRYRRTQIVRNLEKVLDKHPIAGAVKSMPGVGVKIAARLLAEIGGDGTTFTTAAHLAAYAGLAPLTQRPGSCINSKHVNRGGHKRLKDLLSVAAFTSLRVNRASKA